MRKVFGNGKQGKVLREHPPIKMFVSISGTKFKDESICEVAYKHKIKVKSVHFIGEKDWLKLPSQQLASVFHQPLIIRHPQGHTVPRLGYFYAFFNIRIFVQHDETNVFSFFCYR